MTWWEAKYLESFMNLIHYMNRLMLTIDEFIMENISSAKSWRQERVFTITWCAIVSISLLFRVYISPFSTQKQFSPICSPQFYFSMKSWYDSSFLKISAICFVLKFVSQERTKIRLARITCRRELLLDQYILSNFFFKICHSYKCIGAC